MKLKHLAEDWAPIGQPIPELLLQPPPIRLDVLEEKDFEKKELLQENKRLKQRNEKLEEELRFVERDAEKQEKQGFYFSNENGKTQPKLTGYRGSELEQQNEQLKSELAELREKVSQLTLLAKDHDNEGIIMM